MRALLIDPGQICVSEIDTIGNLENLQALVGGPIQMIPLSHDRTWTHAGHVMYVHEEGRLLGLPYFNIHGWPSDYALHGPAVVLGPVDDEGEDTPATITLPELRARVEFLSGLARS